LVQEEQLQLKIISQSIFSASAMPYPRYGGHSGGNQGRDRYSGGGSGGGGGGVVRNLRPFLSS